MDKYFKNFKFGGDSKDTKGQNRRFDDSDNDIESDGRYGEIGKKENEVYLNAFKQVWEK